MKNNVFFIFFIVYGKVLYILIGEEEKLSKVLVDDYYYIFYV